MPTKRGDIKIKPEVIHEYNKSINGCDHLDQTISYYNNFDRKTHKWWKRIFMWILEATQINAFILYTIIRERNTKPKILKTFKELIEQLLDQVSLLYTPGDIALKSFGRPSNVPVVKRVINKKYLIVYDKDDRNCAICSGPGNQKQTNYRCSGCESKPYLHPKNCFLQYHSK